MHALLGNHDILLASGDYEHMKGSERRAFIAELDGLQGLEPTEADLREIDGLNKAFMGDGPYAKWMARRPLMVQIDDQLYAHAGLEAPILDYDIKEVNDLARGWIRFFQGNGKRPPYQSEWLVGMRNGTFERDIGPAFTRVYRMKPKNIESPEVRFEGAPDRALVKKILKHFGAKQMVIGHVPTPTSKIEQHPYYGEMVTLIDTRISDFEEGAISALVVEDGKASPHYFERPLPLCVRPIAHERLVEPVDFAQVVAKLINVRKPTLMTFMGINVADDDPSREDSDHWTFFKGDVDASGDWKVTSLPTGHKETLDTLKLDDEGFDFVSNIKTLPGQIGLIGESRGSGERNALKIFNSKLTNDHNVDCASCHIADRQVFVPSSADSYEGAAKEKFLRTVTKLASGHARVSEILLNGDSQVGRQPYEVPVPRIFGYLDGKAVISQRMGFDSAYAVEAANKVLGLKEKPQCNSEKERRAFMECLYLTEFDAGVSACLKKACK